MTDLQRALWLIGVLGLASASPAGESRDRCHAPKRPGAEPDSRTPVAVNPPIPVGIVWNSPYQIGFGGPPYRRTVEPLQWIQYGGNAAWIGGGCSVQWDLNCPTAPYWNYTAYTYGPHHEPTRSTDPSQANAPAQPQAVPAPSAQPVDEGLEALRTRDFDRAIAVYERRDQEQRELEAAAVGSAPVDRTALRLLALAQAGAGRFDVAAEQLARALKEDSSLFTRSFDAVEILGSRREMRRIVIAAANHAKRTRSETAWEFAALLMEAENRPAVARNWRERWRREQAAPKPEASKPAPRGPASYRVPPTP